MERKKGFYEKFIKRPLDIICSALFLIIFSWLYAILAILVKFKLGSPVIFKQKRPGRNEEIFEMFKFRTMTDDKDENGNLLPDHIRLTPFGKMLRSTSLDELPEIWLIFTGKMSIVGPRPQLVRDMVFMSEEHRKRHDVRPGLTGLAQISGRNAISWEDKLDYDIKYIKNITFLEDLKILLMTIVKVFKREDISADDMETAEDYGDYLLKNNRIDKSLYDRKQTEAEFYINEYIRNKNQ